VSSIQKSRAFIVGAALGSGADDLHFRDAGGSCRLTSAALIPALANVLGYSSESSENFYSAQAGFGRGAGGQRINSCSAVPSADYERPALLKSLAAAPAASKVLLASSAVMATVVSISDKLPPPAAANMAEAAALLSGNSSYHQPVMRSEGQVPTDEPTSDALEEIGDGFLAIASVWPRRPRFRPAF
jgi:hypothetical protein